MSLPVGVVLLWVMGMPFAAYNAYRRWNREFGKSKDVEDEMAVLYFSGLVGVLWPIFAALLLLAKVTRKASRKDKS